MTGDFNGDGKADLAVANKGTNQVSILLGNGNGTFQAPVTYATGTDPEYMVVADFNGDGKADLATANTTGNTVSVLLGNGDGTFQAASGMTAGGAPSAIAAADMNGDGIADLIVSNSSGNTVSIFLGKGDGTFGMPALSYQRGERAEFAGDRRFQWRRKYGRGGGWVGHQCVRAFMGREPERWRRR